MCVVGDENNTSERMISMNTIMGKENGKEETEVAMGQCYLVR